MRNRPDCRCLSSTVFEELCVGCTIEHHTVGQAGSCARSWNVRWVMGWGIRSVRRSHKGDRDLRKQHAMIRPH